MLYRSATERITDIESKLSNRCRWIPLAEMQSCEQRFKVVFGDGSEKLSFISLLRPHRAGQLSFSSAGRFHAIDCHKRCSCPRTQEARTPTEKNVERVSQDQFDNRSFESITPHLWNRMIHSTSCIIHVAIKKSRKHVTNNIFTLSAVRRLT